MKKKILIFGSGSAGRSFLEKNYKFKILYILDNDKKKIGKKIDNIEIIKPDEIKRIDYDYIYITSAFFPEIYNQLVEELNVPEGKIKIPPKSMTGNKKSYRPFECKKTYELAEELLVWISKLLEKNDIKYFVDHGTLLGLVRDGNIIPWDDDIDISVHENEMGKVLNIIENNIETIPLYNSLNWNITKYINEDKDLVSKILISFNIDNNILYRSFPISIESFYFERDKVIQELFYFKKIHFMYRDSIEYKGNIIYTPYNYEEYLEAHYGDWKTIRKDINFTEIPNYKLPNILRIEE